jgi:adenylylsulfate kinase
MNIRTGLDASQHIYPYAFTRHNIQDSASPPQVLWFTGLSAAGKSTIANSLNAVLIGRGLKTAILDGDSLRTGLCRDLGFSEQDRDENVRRIAEVAALMTDAGLTVLVALISPTREARHYARSIIGNDRFVEVFVEVPLAVAEARDPKGLYRRARSGELAGFTGIDSPYEPPVYPELHVRSDQVSVAGAVGQIDAWLRRTRGR